MTFQSVLFVGLVTGSSIIGAVAGMHQEAIRERAADVINGVSSSIPGRIFPIAQPNPVDAMTNVPAHSLAPPNNTGEKEPFQVSSLQKVASSVPPTPIVSKIAADDPFTLAVEAKFQPTTAPIHKPDVPDKLATDSIEIMKSAAKKRRVSEPSQLDVILSAMPSGQNKKTMSDSEKKQTEAIGATRPPAASAKKVAALSMPTGGSPALVRPVARPGQQEKKQERPAFSAKHYHNLRYHMSGHKKKKSKIACVAELQLIASYTQVYFDNGSSLLDDRGASAARQVAAKMQSCPEAKVSIIGFTDPGGTKDVNQRISWSRANSVFRSIKEAGFAMGNIEVSSHMEDHPDYCVHFEGIDRRVVFDVRELPQD